MWACLILTDHVHGMQVFTAISDELRAKSNVELSKTGIHK
jgi:hypothetical protein